MNRHSFVTDKSDKVTLPSGAEFVNIIKYYHKAMNLNNFILDVIEAAEKMGPGYIEWKEKCGNGYFTLVLTNYDNIEVTLFAEELAYSTIPGLAKKIRDVITAHQDSKVNHE